MSETVKGIDGREVDRAEWLRRPFYSFQLWSPLGAHVEALAQIKQGLPVSEDVLAVTEADFQIPYLGEGETEEKFFETIAGWNGKNEAQRQKEGTRETYSEGLLSFIVEIFNRSVEINAQFARINLEGTTATEMKRELLKVAVTTRLNQLERQAGV